MSKKNLIILIILSLVFVLFLAMTGYLIYYFFINNGGKESPGSQTAERDDTEIKAQQQENMRLTYNKEFPDLITGIVNIMSDKKTTIKLKSGIEYLISPARPMSFFSDSGIKNGDFVEVRGKIMGNSCSLGSIIISKD